MTNFYFIDSRGRKRGPATAQQIKSLVDQGIITPNTQMETDTGHRGTAGQVPGLFTAVQPPTIQPEQIPTSTNATDIQPLSTTLLGMKPEVLFTLMYIITIFTTTIIGFLIPIFIWILTKEQDKRADLHGKHIILLTICIEVCCLIAFIGLLTGFPPALLMALIFLIIAIVLHIQLLIHAFYAAEGKVPIYPDGMWVSGAGGHLGKRVWVLCPTPATPTVSTPTPQHAAPVTAGTPVEEIKKMKELLDCGAITQEEFNAFKKKTLGI